MPVSTLSANNIRAPRGSLVVAPFGLKPFGMGTVDLTRTADLTRDPFYSNEYPTKVKIQDDVDQQDYSLGMTIYMISEYAEMMEFLSDAEVADQIAAAGLSYTEKGVVVGQAIITGKRNLKNVTVEDETGIDYVEGEDFVVNANTGVVTILSKPDGAGDDAIVKFDVEAAKRRRYRLGTKSEIRAEVWFIEAVKDGQKPRIHYYPSVGWSPDGDVSMSGSDARRTITVRGALYPNAAGDLGIIDGEPLGR